MECSLLLTDEEILELVNKIEEVAVNIDDGDPAVEPVPSAPQQTNGHELFEDSKLAVNEDIT